MAILIALYIIGFIMCIIVNLINEHSKDRESDLWMELSIVWIMSFLVVPLVMVAGIIYLIGLTMQWITKVVYRKIFKKEEQPK